MNTYTITYFFDGKYHEYPIKAGNIILAIGEFMYKMPYDKIHKIELKS